MTEVYECCPVEGIRRFSLYCSGVTVDLSSRGAAIHRILVPSPDGTVDDIVLGLQNPTDDNDAFLGVIVGRVANRIAKGSFELNGESFSLEINNEPNHLHGGFNGFWNRIWDAEIVDNGVAFSLVSEDGDQGYPGELAVKATYVLTTIDSSNVSLSLDLQAELRGPTSTPINLSNHSYFNLSRHDDPRGVLDHKLQMYCDAYTPVDKTSIPTREIREVEPWMDFREEKALSQALQELATKAVGKSETDALADQQRSGLDNDRSLDEKGSPYGYDHNYVISGPEGCKKVAVVRHEASQRRLTVRADTPGVQFYTGNYLNGQTGKQGSRYRQWQAFCLETQHYPDSITGVDEASEFANGRCVILRPDNPLYHQRTEYQLSYCPSTIRPGHGSDTDGNQYTSLSEMWAIHSADWYTRALDYYEDNCEATLDGVLGGFAQLTDVDLAGSKDFLSRLGARQWSEGAACECGAGIGRVTKGLLLDLGVTRCDLVESSARLLYAAPDYIGDEGAAKCRFYCQGLQDWVPQANSYSIVWIQWVLCYLNDEDVVRFLRLCGQSLLPGVGVIVLKENSSNEEDYVVDVDDASICRSIPYWSKLIRQAGLQIVYECIQVGFPDSIFPVYQVALELR